MSRRETSAAKAGPARVADLAAGALAVGATLAGAGAALAFMRRVSMPIPFSDEWLHVPFVFGPGAGTLRELFRPLNEHFVPVPRLVWAASFLGAGGDARGAAMAMVPLVTLAAILFLLAARRLRGSWSVADLLVPVAIFTPVQFETALAGVNNHFAISVLLLAVALLLVAPPTPPDGRRVVLVGAVVLLLSLSGAIGMLYLVPFAAWTCWAAFGAEGLPRRTRAGALALVVAALSTFAFHVVTFRREHPVLPYDAGLAPKGGAAALATILGPLAAPRQVATGALLAAVAAATLFVVVRGGWRAPERRWQAAGLAGGILAVLLLALGIGYGRASGGEGAAFLSRYATLVAPLFCAIHLGLVAFGGRRIAPAVSTLLAVVLLAAFPSGARQAARAGGLYRAKYDTFAADVRAGLPLDVLAGRDSLSIWEYDIRETPRLLRLLATERLGPFAEPGVTLRERTMRLHEEPVSLDALAPHDLARSGDAWAPTGPDPFFDLRLPTPLDLSAIRVRFRIETADGDLAWVSLGWSGDGRDPVTDLLGVAVPGGPGEQTHRWPVARRVDRIRISPGRNLRRLELREVTLLVDEEPIPETPRG